jgi:hypothetical protein
VVIKLALMGTRPAPRASPNLTRVACATSKFGLKRKLLVKEHFSSACYGGTKQSSLEIMKSPPKYGRQRA